MSNITLTSEQLEYLNVAISLIAHKKFKKANLAFLNSLPDAAKEDEHLCAYNLKQMGLMQHAVVKQILDIYNSNDIYKNCLKAQKNLK